MTEFDAVYDVLQGDTRIPEELYWVENAFAEGSFCDAAYKEVFAANERLRERLGVIEEDEDVEIIISSMFDIQRELCQRMFSIGREYDKHVKESMDEIMRRYL